MIQYHLSQGTDGHQTLTVFDPNDGTIVIANDNPQFDFAVNIAQGKYGYRGLATNEADIERLREIADVVSVVEDRVLNADVRIKDRRVVLSDGNFVGDVIERKILDAIAEDDLVTYQSLAAFLASLAKNPSQRSREQLYSWLDKHGFKINVNGSFGAWKGVGGSLHSLHSGFALVDGNEVTGNVPNSVGSVIEFPRERVDDDPSVGCSTGLHVGSREFAEGFGSRLLQVAVRPEDVVSVPSDSNEQKVRVCRYVVVQEVTNYSTSERSY